MEKDTDMTLTCRQCNKEFTFTKGEQEFYKEKGFTLPHRCKECRTNGKQQPQPILCSKCGKKLGTGAIYCGNCFLADDKLVFEIKTKTPQVDTSDGNGTGTEHLQLVNENIENLSTTGLEKARLVELLQQKELKAAELQERLNNTIFKLEETITNYASLDSIGTTLKTILEKLEALENTQNSLNHIVLRMINETQLKESLPEVSNELSGHALLQSAKG